MEGHGLLNVLKSTTLSDISVVEDQEICDISDTVLMVRPSCQICELKQDKGESTKKISRDESVLHFLSALIKQDYF